MVSIRADRLVERSNLPRFRCVSREHRPVDGRGRGGQGRCRSERERINLTPTVEFPCIGNCNVIQITSRAFALVLCSNRSVAQSRIWIGGLEAFGAKSCSKPERWVSFVWRVCGVGYFLPSPIPFTTRSRMRTNRGQWFGESVVWVVKYWIIACRRHIKTLKNFVNTGGQNGRLFYHDPDLLDHALALGLSAEHRA
jgi:hypothetical protein